MGLSFAVQRSFVIFTLKYFLALVLAYGAISLFSPVDLQAAETIGIEESNEINAFVPKAFLPYWNKLSIRRLNNCYNYATNRKTNTFAQPGQAGGVVLINPTCESISKAAAADWGIEPTEYFEYQTKDDYTLLALAVAPGLDYHWYRRDDNQFWTHKVGSHPATDRDSRGRKIRSPERADRGKYKTFCGYFKIRNDKASASRDEQNAGYVRIGAMSTLPNYSQTVLNWTMAHPEPTSQVEWQIFSGRTNPAIDLRTLQQESDYLRFTWALLLNPTQSKVISPPTGDGYLISDGLGMIEGDPVFIWIEKGRAYKMNEAHTEELNIEPHFVMALESLLRARFSTELNSRELEFDR